MSSSESRWSAKWRSSATWSFRVKRRRSGDRCGESRPMAGGRTERGSRRRTRAGSVVVPFPAARPAIAWISLGSSLPVARCSSGSRSSSRSSPRTGVQRRRPSSPSSASRWTALRPRSPVTSSWQRRTSWVRVSSRSTRRCSRARCARFRRSPVCPSTVPSRTRSSSAWQRSGPSPSCAAPHCVARHGRRQDHS